MDINSELMKLQTSHKNAIQRRDDAKKELARERNHQKQQKWEMDSLVRREKDFKEQLDKVHMEIVALRSHMPVLGENCILPSPIFSFCYNCQATNNKKNHVFSLFFDRGGLPALSTGMDFYELNVLLFTFFRHHCA